MTFNLIKNLQYYNIQLISGLNFRMAICTMYFKQAFDSIAGNTVVPYRSLKKFFNYHKLLFIAI